jgi:hypothetical protein
MPSCLANSKRLVSMLASESGVLYSQWKKRQANQTADHATFEVIEPEEL